MQRGNREDSAGDLHKSHIAALLLWSIAVLQPQAKAQAASGLDDRVDGVHWEFMAGPYVHHWRKNEEHRSAFLIALERHGGDSTLWAAALFRNSFGQPSAYAYYGREWPNFLGHPKLYFKLTGGIIYGYVGEHRLPLSFRGFAPAIIPIVGWKLTEHDKLQVVVLAHAGVMFSYSRRF